MMVLATNGIYCAGQTHEVLDFRHQQGSVAQVHASILTGMTIPESLRFDLR